MSLMSTRPLPLKSQHSLTFSTQVVCGPSVEVTTMFPSTLPLFSCPFVSRCERRTQCHRPLYWQFWLGAGHQGYIVHPQGLAVEARAQNDIRLCCIRWGGELAPDDAPTISVLVQRYGQLRVA